AGGQPGGRRLVARRPPPGRPRTGGAPRPRLAGAGAVAPHRGDLRGGRVGEAAQRGAGLGGRRRAAPPHRPRRAPQAARGGVALPPRRRAPRAPLAVPADGRRLPRPRARRPARARRPPAAGGVGGGGLGVPPRDPGPDVDRVPLPPVRGGLRLALRRGAPPGPPPSDRSAGPDRPRPLSCQHLTQLLSCEQTQLRLSTPTSLPLGGTPMPKAVGIDLGTTNSVVSVLE